MNDLIITSDMKSQLEECAEFYGYTININDTLLSLLLEVYRYNDIQKCMGNIRDLIGQILFIRKCGSNGFVMSGNVSVPDVGEVKGMEIQVNVKSTSVISKIEQLLCCELADRIEDASCYFCEDDCEDNGSSYSNEDLKEILEKVEQIDGYDKVRGNAHEGKMLLSLHDYLVGEKVWDEGSMGRRKKYSFLFDVWKIVGGMRHEYYVSGFLFKGEEGRLKYEYVKNRIEAYNKNKLLN